MRGQILISLVLFVLVGAGVGTWWSLEDVPSYARGSNRFYVVETSYEFSPSRMTWRVGQRVSLTLVDQDQSVPPKNHEFMMGRGGPNTTPTPFTRVALPGGFKEDFFAGVPVSAARPRNVVALFHPKNPIAGPAAGAPFVKPFKMAMPTPQGPKRMPPNLMLVLRGDGGTLTLTFTVPNRPGRWEFGCFAQDSQHFLNGMRGTVDVVA